MRYTAEQFSARLGEPTIGVHRGELQALLVRSLPADVVKTGMCCTGIDQSERGVTVHFQNGDSAQADIVVGADGRRSLVRRALLGDRPLHDSQAVGWRGTAPAPSGSDPDDPLRFCPRCGWRLRDIAVVPGVGAQWCRVHGTATGPA